MSDLDPFITLTDLSNYLGRDVTADDGAVIALDAACEICRDMTDQRINRGTAVFTLDGTGTDAVLLPQLPVNSAGTVTVDGEAEDEYVLNSNGILFRGTAGCDPRPTWPSGRQNIVVTVDYGYDATTIPRSLKMVALAIASRLVIQGVATEESVGGVRIKYAVASTDLTSGEKIILRKHRPTR